MYPDNERDFFEPKPDVLRRQEKRRVLLYFVGGITFAEIGAIRFLNDMQTSLRFYIATTQIINGNSAVN